MRFRNSKGGTPPQNIFAATSSSDGRGGSKRLAGAGFGRVFQKSALSCANPMWRKHGSKGCLRWLKSAFAIPGDLSTPTGGYAYDRQVSLGCPHADRGPTACAAGLVSCPVPDDLAETLRLIEELAPGTILLVDGLAYGRCRPTSCAITHPIIALVHHPLGLELVSAKADAFVSSKTRRRPRAGRRRVVTSRTTARLLATDFGVPRHRIHVAEPGTEPARRSGVRAAGSGCWPWDRS